MASGAKHPSASESAALAATTGPTDSTSVIASDRPVSLMGEGTPGAGSEAFPPSDGHRVRSGEGQGVGGSW